MGEAEIEFMKRVKLEERLKKVAPELLEACEEALDIFNRIRLNAGQTGTRHKEILKIEATVKKAKESLN